MPHPRHPNCGFQKGHKAWCKGLTKETDKRLKEAGKKITKTLTGRKLTKEHRQKLSESHQGPRPWRKGKKFPYIPHYGKRGQPAWNKGIKCSQWSGKYHWNWQGGKSSLLGTIRNSFKYRQWRSDIFTRDDFTCQQCNDDRGGNLEAHHIISLSLLLQKYEITNMEAALKCEALWNLNNGITLCTKCHEKTINFGNRMQWVK